VVIPYQLPVTSASATSSSASAYIAKLARPFMLHEHITSTYTYHNVSNLYTPDSVSLARQ